jgi:putative ABC transport system permease protein
MMNALLSLAIRNVFRNKARSGLTMGAIAFGVLMTMLLGSLVVGLGNIMIDDVILGRTGALQVHQKGYDDVKDSQPLDFDLPAKGELLDRIAQTEGVLAVAPRLVFSGLISNGSQSTPMLAMGVDPDAEYRVLTWARNWLTGKPVTAQANHGALLGKDLADALEMKLGDAGTVQAATKNGQQNALDFEAVGTTDNGNAFESKRQIFVPLAFAQDLLGMPGRITEIAVAVRDRDAVEDTAARLRARLGPGYEVQTWAQLRPNVQDVVLFQHIVLGVICVVFLVIAVIGVINTMLMSVLERTREIGTMMAVGVKRGAISALFLLESVALAVLGGGAGMALALSIIRVVAGRGGIAANAPGSTAVYFIVPATPAGLVLPTLLATLLGTALAGVYPAYRASRLRPVEALRDA